MKTKQIFYFVMFVVGLILGYFLNDWTSSEPQKVEPDDSEINTETDRKIVPYEFYNVGVRVYPVEGVEFDESGITAQADDPVVSEIYIIANDIPGDNNTPILKYQIIEISSYEEFITSSAESDTLSISLFLREGEKIYSSQFNDYGAPIKNIQKGGLYEVRGVAYIPYPNSKDTTKLPFIFPLKIEN